MKDQPWDLNQTWPVGRKWCQFTNAPTKLLGPFPKFGAQHIKFFTTFRDFHTRHRISLELNIASPNNVSIYNVFLKSWPTFCDLWPRNGWDPFAHL